MQDLRVLASICSPSGDESCITEYLVKEFSHIYDECYVDNIGNVIVKKKGKTDTSLMLISHMDEIGFMVTFIDERGFIYFDKIGGIAPDIIPGLMLKIHNRNKAVYGVIGIPIWNRDKGLECQFGDLWLDIGAKSREEAMNLVSIGDYISFVPTFEVLNNHAISSKSLDNRVGVYILSKVMKDIASLDLDKTIYAVFSTKEEIGCIGATVAVNNLKPTECIVIDATHATDYPTSLIKTKGDIKINNGVAIGVGADTSVYVSNKLIQLATEHSLDYQREPIPRNSYTEANVIQNSSIGIKTGILSVPCRYMHSPHEICGIDDITTTIRLLKLYCNH